MVFFLEFDSNLIHGLFNSLLSLKMREPHFKNYIFCIQIVSTIKHNIQTCYETWVLLKAAYYKIYFKNIKSYLI